MGGTPHNRQSRARSLGACLGLAALLLTAAPRPALAIYGDTMGLFGVDGSLRMIGAGILNPPTEVPDELDSLVSPLLPDRGDGVSQLLVRLAAGGWPTDWMTYEAHLVQSISMTTAATSGVGVVGSAASGTRYRAVDAHWRWGKDEGIEAVMWPDRLNVSFALPFADVTVGRQAISFGKAHFWNPLDVFLAFDPFQFDRDYKAGVDALRMDFPLDDFSGLTVVGVMADPSEEHLMYRSGALLRLWGMLFDWDLALQSGLVYGGYHVGAGAVGELLGLETRFEASYLHPEAVDTLEQPDAPGALPVLETPAMFTGVFGLARRFESSLFVSVEYLYNGAGRETADMAWALLADAQIQHVSEHVLGTMATYELFPLLNLSLATVVALDDPSVLVQPGLVYSAADEVEILAGAMLAFGKRPGIKDAASLASFSTSSLVHSEFGTYPHMFYVEMKAYF
jgi:hypothetical protein